MCTWQEWSGTLVGNFGGSGAAGGVSWTCTRGIGVACGTEGSGARGALLISVLQI